ncbi:N-6 DNA methylase [Flammeovirgaceae bacterium 311]|nr:N-6 DNA methylase [Flammeovirgaceae bacterium 311]
MVDSIKPSFVLDFNNDVELEQNEKVKAYLTIGIEKGVHKKYKTIRRKKWYKIPSIGSPTDGFFFRRSDQYPKIIKNEAQVLSTDSAYILSMQTGYNIESLVYSFYNSVTLAFAELYGRYYGGGVLELTPNEFRKLPVPYMNLSVEDFSSFALMFKNKASINEVCAKNDYSILTSSILNIDNEVIDKVSQIRKKLIMRRIKKEGSC